MWKCQPRIKEYEKYILKVTNFNIFYNATDSEMKLLLTKLKRYSEQLKNNILNIK